MTMRIEEYKVMGVAKRMEEGYRERILGRNWDKSLKIFPPYYSQSPLLTGFTPPPLENKWFETGL